MKTKSPKTWFFTLIVVAVAAIFCTVTGWLLANPADEITKAVAVSGAKSVSEATPQAFINAFTAVLAESDETETADYVAAAQRMRPDLKAQITTAAAAVESGPVDETTDDHSVSQHGRHVKVCCHDHTILIHRHQVHKFLASHPDCHKGACNVFTTPPPQPTT